VINSAKWIRAKYIPIAGALVLLPAAAAPAAAQNTYEPFAQIETTSAMVGIGGQSGAGRLNLPNLGTNCSYTFQVSGFGAGIQVGVSKVSASGPVKNLARLEDFPGEYGATEGQATVIAGAGGISMKNKANNVTVNLASQTAGLNIGFSGSGMTVNMPVPPANAPRVLVLEYGYNKDRLNLANRAKLDQMLRVWKCRFVNFTIVGRTDSVGKQAENLNLSETRSRGVRDYLQSVGVYPPRLPAKFSGEDNPQVETQQGTRLRANRVVVVTVVDQ
jgi:outer membrane protein OmpA-like peptidoglycan-associated protein